MPKNWSFTARVDASPEDVFGWMSDYQHDDHANERFKRGSGAKPDGKPSHRTVERLDDGRISVHDEWGRERFDMQVELAPSLREVRLRGQYGYHGVWRANADGAGTLVTSEGGLEPSGLMRLLAPLFAGALMKQMKADFDGHIADMRETLARKG